jgi:transposase
MPPKRRPLGEISRNVQKRKELDPFTRGQIIGASKCGISTSAIGKRLSIPRTTVRDTLSLNQLRNNGESLPRAGRPRLTSKQDERLLLRIVRRFPKYTYQQLKAFSRLKISISTMRCILKRHHILTWCAKRRPALNKKNAKNYYLWY